MTRNLTILAGILAVCCSAYAVDGKGSYAQYRSIIDDKTISSQAERTAKLRQHLCSLTEPEFFDFIRELAKDPEYDWEKHEEAPIGMAMVAKIYYGTGQTNNALSVKRLGDLSDPSLPDAWKWAILDALRLHNRCDLSDSETTTVVALLSRAGADNRNSDRLRSVCLHKLGSFLSTQREIITQKAPDVKDALEKQDKTALPKRGDANVRRAAKLIDAIRHYRMALQKTADEVQDEQIKAQLKKRLSKWQPASAGPPQ